jgi:uncharacterized membrane protein (DUF4010 family)
MDILLRLLLTMFIGFIIGIERDESWQDKESTVLPKFTFMRAGKPAKGLGGVRTYTLIAILGFLCGLTFFTNSSLILISIAAFIGLILLVTASFVLNYFDKNTFGLTSEISIFILFILGFMLGQPHFDYKILIGIAVIISLLLSLKFELRRFISTFTKKEILESLEFVLITAVIFPWLPDVNITFGNVFRYFAYDDLAFKDVVLFNPQKLWLVIIFVTSLNFVGYFLIKLFKNNKSILLTGFLGGLVSSTTVTQLMALKSRTTNDKSTIRFLAATALISNSTSFARIPFIILVLNKELFSEVLVSMLLMTIVGFGVSILAVRNTNINIDAEVIFKSPLGFKSALFFGVLFVSVQILTQFGVIFLGDAGFAITTLIASISGLDAVAFNTARAIPSPITLQLGAVTLIGATIINLIGKLIISIFIGNSYFNKLLTIFFTLIIVVGTVGLTFTLF